jgi:hypothetical protein
LGGARAGTLTTPGVVFRGEPGIGKSRLATAAAELVEASGSVVVELIGSSFRQNDREVRQTIVFLVSRRDLSDRNQCHICALECVAIDSGSTLKPRPTTSPTTRRRTDGAHTTGRSQRSGANSDQVNSSHRCNTTVFDGEITGLAGMARCGAIRAAGVARTSGTRGPPASTRSSSGIRRLSLPATRRPTAQRRRPGERSQRCSRLQPRLP